MKLKEPQETLEIEVNGLKHKTVPMIYDGKNWVVISDEEVQFLNEGNRKERKANLFLAAKVEQLINKLNKK